MTVHSYKIPLSLPSFLPDSQCSKLESFQSDFINFLNCELFFVQDAYLGTLSCQNA